MRKITIHRKAYCKKPFVRATGAKVKAFCVPSTTFTEIAKFETAGQKLGFKPKKGKLTRFGYHVDLPVSARHKALKKAHSAYGGKLFRMLQAQVLFRKRADGARETFMADRNWVKENLMSMKEKRKMTAPAVSAWKRMPHYKRVLARAGV